MTIQGPTILLQSGKYFSFTEPAACEFTIEDIAHGLSNICRFTGQSQNFYSVAEHSVHCSHLVPAADALEGLMHDAAEAFIGDVSRPLKQLLPDYKVIEERVEHAIAERFGLRYPWPPSVKHTDAKMLRAEQHQLMQCDDDWACLAGVDLTALGQRELVCLPPVMAKSQFLARFRELGGVL